MPEFSERVIVFEDIALESLSQNQTKKTCENLKLSSKYSKQYLPM